jgi:BirA family transcriptional regulator, biotin operon repressor / biotin---[acetyl-CoA-carboxylase] ligase
MSSVPPTVAFAPPELTEARLVTVAGWTVHYYHEATSTNLVAASCPVWHAVCAGVQTAGRGRFQRRWISDEGGLWLSAVVPLPAVHPSALLPLLAGLAVCSALHHLAVKDVRMRWPNDVMIQRRKLAGLLIDQFEAGLAVVGIGLNISNRPDEQDRALIGSVARLADAMMPVPPPTAVLAIVLSQLKAVCLEWHALGPEPLLPRINDLWQTPVPVELDLDGRMVRGQFEGVDTTGRLRVRSGAGATNFYEPHQVRLLREMH